MTSFVQIQKLKWLLPISICIATLWILLNTFEQPQNSLASFFSIELIDIIPPASAKWQKASISIGDFNNDGLNDFFVSSNARGYLYQNNGNSFRQLSDAETSTSFTYVHMGLWSDFNNDGCQDLFVTRQSRGKFGYLEGDCTGKFTDLSENINPEISVNGYGATAIDFNNDGKLDVFSTSFDRDHHKNFEYPQAVSTDTPAYTDAARQRIITLEPNVLLLQEDDSFIQQTYDTKTEVLKGGLFGSISCADAREYDDGAHEKLGEKFGYKQGYQPIWFDANNDGILDVYVAYDFGFGALYQQNEFGEFKDVTAESGLCFMGNAMGVTVGDINNDGFYDLYVSNTGSNFFYINNGDGTFRERSAEAGITNFNNIGWGTSFADFNNDMFLDIVLSNGRLMMPDWPFDELDAIYMNNHDETFQKIDINHISLLDFFTDPATWHDADAGVATGDLNNDGFSDAIIFRPHTGAVYILYGKPNKNNWLTLSLKGTKSNRDAVGARIDITSGNTTQTRTVTAGSSYLSQNAKQQTIGLGTHDTVDTITIHWPSGIKQTLTDISVNQIMYVTEPTESTFD